MLPFDRFKATRTLLKALTPQALQRTRAITTNTQSPLNIEHVSSINALPVEILMKIFICCLPESIAFIVPTAKEAPLLLCSVCRLWRSTAISTPFLWSSLRMASNLSPKFINIWLSRARVGPLSIALTLDSGSVHANLPLRPKRLRIHMDTLLPLSNRWKSLEITVMPRAPLNLLDGLSEHTFPSLETLIVRYPQGTRMYDDRSPLDDVFRSSSQLRQVFVFGDDSTVSIPMLRHLPHSHMKILCTDSLMYPEEFIRLLSRWHKLEQGFFRLAHWCFPVPLPMPSDCVMLKDMRTLSLQTFTSLAVIFALLSLPALAFLRISFGRIESWTHGTFLSFISPFSSTLCTLHLDEPPVSEEQLIEYLRFLPSLTELGLKDRMNFASIGNGLVSSLTYRSDDDEAAYACLCPKLTKLELFGVHACEDEYLVDMLESRWGQQAPASSEVYDNFRGWYQIPEQRTKSQIPPQLLTSFQLRLRRAISAYLSQRLNALKDEGMLLVYHDHTK